jgi:hypothetical protein
MDFRGPLVGLFLAGVAIQAAQGAPFVEKTPYLSAADSPFDTSAGGFYIEDFEDQVLDTPGVTLTSAHGTGLSHCSVDGDDGVIDGSGVNGWSLMSTTSAGTTGVTFTFDGSVLSGLPQVAGIVVTCAGVDPLVFEAFDALGTSVGTVVKTLWLNDPTSDDLFLGVRELGGISSISLTSGNALFNLHLDHLQYGPVPEPATLGLLALGGLGVLLRRRGSSA